MALVGYMHRDFVENKKWINDSDFKEGLALSQLAPGPLATQLGIYIGFVHFGVLGAILSGIAFIIPSFIMVVLLGMVYQAYGALPWMQAVFYGISAAVIGIIVISSYKLTVKSISKFEIPAIKTNWLLWLFYISAIILTAITQKEEVLLFVVLGFIYMIVKAPPKWMKRPKMVSLFYLLLLDYLLSNLEN